jgi:hypothetical protein
MIKKLLIKRKKRVIKLTFNYKEPKEEEIDFGLGDLF